MTQHSCPPTFMEKFCTAAKTALTLQEQTTAQKPSRMLHWKTCTLQGRSLMIPKESKRLPASARTRALLGPQSRAQVVLMVQTAPGPVAAAGCELLQKRATRLLCKTKKVLCSQQHTCPDISGTFSARYSDCMARPRIV